MNLFMWLFVVSHVHSMELTFIIRNVVCLCLLHLSATNSTDLNIVVTCNKTDLEPDQGLTQSTSNPSPLRDLEVEVIYLNEAPDSLALNISWFINVDSSIHSITGTEIEVNMARYSCEYQPPFTSRYVHPDDTEQLGFYYISKDDQINDFYHVVIWNLPLALDQREYRKQKWIHAPGCDDERMRTNPSCLEKEVISLEDLNITTEPMNDQIQVTFQSLLNSLRYEIRLRRGTHILDYIDLTAVETDILQAKLKYTGPCENLEIGIIPVFDHCGVTCKSFFHDVACLVPSTAAPTEEPKKKETSILWISIWCSVAITLLLICLIWGLCMHCAKYSRHGRNSAQTLSVLVVYPAVDSVFQNAVMAIADFLRSHKDLNVIIDVWQRGNLAEQGPLRWLNSQVGCAEKVLIVLPPQRTEFSRNTIVTDYTVPASASQLFSLALNLVASCASDPQQNQKFLVVHLDHGGNKCTRPVELRSCKTLVLPRDLEKLHQLYSRQEVTISDCRFEPYNCQETAMKVRDAVQQLNKKPL